MNVVIIDTNVVSYQFKQDTRGALYTPHMANALSAICFMTLAELQQWAIIHNWGKRRHGELLQFISDNFVIADSNEALCLKWAEVKGAVRRTGHVIETAAAWIAATALLHNAPLITHNAADFEHVPGLTVISER